MPDDHFSGIEVKLDALASGQTRIETRLDGLEVGQARLRSDVTGLKADVSGLKAGQIRIETRLNKVQVGLEDVSDRVKQVAEGHAAVLAAIERGVRTVCGHIDKRVAPLETVVRNYLEPR
jgi:hypothetical protein